MSPSFLHGDYILSATWFDGTWRRSQRLQRDRRILVLTAEEEWLLHYVNKSI